jgi:hypothetical protein
VTPLYCGESEDIPEKHNSAGPLCALTMLSIEKNFVREIPNFNDSVIDCFAVRTNGLNCSIKSHKLLCRALFLIFLIKNGSGAYPAYPMGTRGSFPGDKVAGA